MRRRGAWPSAAGWISGQNRRRRLRLGSNGATQDLDAVGEQLALADPLAEIIIHFDCPVCGVSFDESLDLSAFLWAELEGQAKRLLYDVHTLAAAYSWSEAEILSLSATRREFYLGMVRG